MTIETSTQAKKKDDVLERFADFCRRRSRRQMSEKTLVRYVQVIDTLNRKHGLSLEVVDIREVERVTC